MNTIKNVVVILTLLGVGYGAHVVLNQPISQTAEQYGASVSFSPPSNSSNPSYSPDSGFAVNRRLDTLQAEVAMEAEHPSFAQAPEPIEQERIDRNVRHQSHNDAVSSAPGFAPEPSDQDLTSRVPLTTEASSYPTGTASGNVGRQLEHVPIESSIPRLVDDHVENARSEQTARNEIVDSPAPDQSPTEPLTPQTDIGSSLPGASGTQAIWDSIREKLDRNELVESLHELSTWYLSASDPSAESPELVRLMDQLAGTVIYSRQHYLDEPRVVEQGETLEQIAGQYNVPVTILAKINGIPSPYDIDPGEELKVVTGPFHGLASVSRRELAIFTGPYYAGRFPIRFGDEFVSPEEIFEVVEKSTQRPYVDPDTQVQIAAGDPLNPYGNHWIGLRASSTESKDTISIHGIGQQCRPDDTRGCIRLVPRDAEDIFAILSQGSKITFIR